jgi:hypothetical protein
MSSSRGRCGTGESLWDVVSQYRRHPLAESLAPDGSACKPDTRGLLRRTPVTAAGFRYIGKETDRRWEQGEDISMLESEVLEYRPNETARLVVDPALRSNIRNASIGQDAGRKREHRKGCAARPAASEGNGGEAREGS